MIIVIDANVYVSAFQFASATGVPTRALARAMATDVIAICDEIEIEITRILVDKLLWTYESVEESLGKTLERSVRVRIRGTVSVCRILRTI